MITKVSVSVRPRMWVSGSTSNWLRLSTWAMTSRPTTDSSASKTAAAHGDIFSVSDPGR
jgi:hypothetical protein